MHFVKFLVIAGLIIAIIFGGMQISKALDNRRIESERKAAIAQKEAARQASAKQLATLKTQLSAIIDDSPNVSISVSVIDLGTNERTQAGLNVGFRAASTTKVLSVAAYMHEVSQGKASLDTTIKGTTAQTLIERMLRNSDNNAWAAIDAYLGDNKLVAYAASLGLDSYDISDNVLDTNDMATLMAKLYQNDLMSAAHTKLILSFMQDTNNETLIPPALPEGATFYHKFGLYEGELHDAAIVSYQGRQYVLVIYTNNQKKTLSDGGSRIDLIQNLTTTVVDSFRS